ncbi:hypothetical protein [Sporosarcina sp. FSL K6-3457]|uniref:hypothetical protein n=1 Tax=Sporosarcina sp. FSL K6-3457 TaxID=2978204 RepID=UPI0030FCB3B0
MKLKHLLMASVLFASTLAITPASLTNAQEIKGEGEVWMDYNYNDVKDLPSKVKIDLTNPEEISTLDIKYLAFGEGHTYLNRDSQGWWGTHATSVSNGKLVVFFSVVGTLLRLPKGNTVFQRLDEDSTTVWGKQDGFASVTTKSGTKGESGDKYIAESIHQVQVGTMSSSTHTIEEITLK